MRIALNTLLFSERIDTDLDRLDLVRELGYDGVELGFPGREGFDLDAVKRRLDVLGLTCSSLSGLFGPDRDLRSDDPALVTNSRRYVMEAVDACVELGCRTFVGPMYSAVGRAALESPGRRAEQWVRVVENLRDVGRHAAARDVRLGIEPLNRFETDFLNVCADARRLIEEVGCSHVKIHLDLFHACIEERSLHEAIRTAGADLVELHVSESHRGVPGTGQTDWAGVKSALAEIGYDGWVVLESFTPEIKSIARAAAIWRQVESSPDEFARKALSFLRRTFA